MRKFLLALALLSIPLSSGAFAQQQTRGTPDEQKAVAEYEKAADPDSVTVPASVGKNRLGTT